MGPRKRKMKRKILICLLFLSLCAGANALTMTLSDSTLDFGTMALGEWKEISAAGGYHNRLSVVSDNSNVWMVYIKTNQALTNTDLPSVTIPNTAFKWMSTYAGSQNAPYTDLSAGLNHKAADGYVPFSLVNELVYTSGQVSGSSDNNNLPNGTEIQFKYGIGMPDSQTAGTYTTTITYTVTQ